MKTVQQYLELAVAHSLDVSTRTTFQNPAKDSGIKVSAGINHSLRLSCFDNQQPLLLIKVCAIQSVNADLLYETSWCKDYEVLQRIIRKAAGVIFNIDNHIYFQEENVVVYEWPHILYEDAQ